MYLGNLADDARSRCSSSSTQPVAGLEKNKAYCVSFIFHTIRQHLVSHVHTLWWDICTHITKDISIWCYPPWSRSSVMILVVWFHVLSMKTTLSNGEDCSFTLWASSTSSVTFCLFNFGSSVKFVLISLRCCNISSTVTESGPGKTKIVWWPKQEQ